MSAIAGIKPALPYHPWVGASLRLARLPAQPEAEPYLNTRPEYINGL